MKKILFGTCAFIAGALIFLVMADFRFGEYAGLSAEGWVRLWGSILSPLILGSIALYAAKSSWKSAHSNEQTVQIAVEAEERKANQERRDEFWKRLSESIQLVSSADTEQFGMLNLNYLFEEVSHDQRYSATEISLLLDSLNLALQRTVQIDESTSKLSLLSSENLEGKINSTEEES